MDYYEYNYKRYLLKLLAVVLLLILFVPNLFYKGRIIMQSEMSSAQTLVTSERAWNWSNELEFYYVEEITELEDILEVQIESANAKNKISLSDISLYWGSWRIQRFTVDDYIAYCEFSYDPLFDEEKFVFEEPQLMLYINLEQFLQTCSIFRFISCVVISLSAGYLAYLLYEKREEIYTSLDYARVWIIERIPHDRRIKVKPILSFDLIIFFIVYILNLKWEFFSEGEFRFWCIGVLVLSVFLMKYIINMRQIIFGGTAISIPLIFSIERMTDYLLVDEPRAIAEQLELEADALRHWYFGYSRMNYSIMGTILKDIPDSILEWLNVSGYQYAKLLHWLVAIIILGFICRLVVDKCIEGRYKFVEYIFVLGTFLTLSVMLNALKFYNYDTFAVLFGIWGTLYLYLSIKDRDLKLSYWSLIILSMALQEKNIALPFFCLALVNCAYLNFGKKISEGKNILGSAFFSTGKAIAVPVAIFYVTTLYVSVVLRESQFPNITFADTVLPFTAVLVKVLQVFPIIDSSFAYFHECTMALTFFGIALLLFAGYKLSEQEEVRRLWNIIVEKAGFITLIAIAAVWIIGIVSVYALPNMFIDPVYENVNEYYISSTQMTALRMYFASSNILVDMLCFICALYGISVEAFPTIILAIGILVLLLYKYDTDNAWNGLFLFVEVIIPFAYGVMHLVPWLRYMNIYIAVALVLLIIRFCKIIEIMPMQNKKLAVSSISLATIVLAAFETYAFAPVYYGYWPIWNTAPYKYEYVEAGETMTVWQGGVGEDMSLAGNKIIDYCEENDIDFSKIEIYSNYHGTWNGNYLVRMMPGWRKSYTQEYPEFSLEDFYFDDNHFYVFTRWGESCALVPYQVPRDIEPLLTVEYRGCTEAWIFTGAQLKEHLEKFMEEYDS